ncbi:hypothetical protein RSAG8_06305, partial [Rhizoctonia solani AG-8 WAC10335]
MTALHGPTWVALLQRPDPIPTTAQLRLRVTSTSTASRIRPQGASIPRAHGAKTTVACRAPVDRGRTWYNTGGTKVATTGSSTVSVTTSGIIQESQTVDSANQPHVIISYVPGRFTQCVQSYAADRIAYARAFHLYRSSNGTWTKVEIPFALGSSGRSQIVMDASDNVYVVLPFLKIVTASKSSGWTDWTLAYDGVTAGLNAFGEVTVDRLRVKSEGVLSVLYQVNSSGTAPSAVMVADFKLNG